MIITRPACSQDWNGRVRLRTRDRNTSPPKLMASGLDNRKDRFQPSLVSYANYRQIENIEPTSELAYVQPVSHTLRLQRLADVGPLLVLTMHPIIFSFSDGIPPSLGVLQRYHPVLNMSPPHTIRQYYTQGDGWQNLKLQEVSLPKPRASEVTLKIHAVSLQYRDLMVSKGRLPGSENKKCIPGSDAAGEIVAIGEDVKGWEIGDRVCPNFTLDHIHGDITEKIKNTGLGGRTDGVLREYVNLPAHSLVRIPEHLSYEQGSTLPCAALTAYNALLGPVPLKGGDYVVVLGTGGVSIFAAQIALASGAIVIATSSSDKKLEIVKKLGVQHVINYSKTPNWEEEVLEITNGNGADHIIEVGGSNTILKSTKAVKFNGHIHLIGIVSGGDTGLPILAATNKAITLRGILIGSVKQFEDMNRLLTARQIYPVIDKTFAFEQLIDAYAYLESQKHVGKIVIKVSKD